MPIDLQPLPTPAPTANPYCTVEQFADFYDTRAMGMLSQDNNTRVANAVKLQTLLNNSASELETHLSARVPLPLVPLYLAVIPSVLTKWVAVRTAATLYGRRTAKPRELQDDIKWADDWIAAWDRGETSIGVPRTVPPLTLERRARWINRPVTGLLAGTTPPGSYVWPRENDTHQ